MKSNNRYSLMEFLLWNILFMAVAFVWYDNLFKCMDNLTYKESRDKLVRLIILFIVLGISLELKKRRNRFSIFINVVFPYGIYTAVVYWDVKDRYIRIVIGTCIVVFITYSILVLMQRAKKKIRVSQLLKRKVEKIIVAAQKIFATGLAVIICIIAGDVMWNNTIVNTSVEATNYGNTGNTIESNIRTLVKLESNTWKKLSIRERLDVLQVVANVEQNYLGVNDLNVTVREMDDSINGSYDDGKHNIMINFNHIQKDSSWDLVKTVTHEAYHSYEYKLIELYRKVDDNYKKMKIFKNVEEYIYEFDNYNDGSYGIDEYYRQKCEKNAREYSEEAVLDYYEQITDYSEK